MTPIDITLTTVTEEPPDGAFILWFDPDVDLTHAEVYFRDDGCAESSAESSGCAAVERWFEVGSIGDPADWPSVTNWCAERGGVLTRLYRTSEVSR